MTTTIPGTSDAAVIVPEGTSPPPAIPADVFAAAAKVYASGRRLDMQALARQVGVGRATLYRHTGNRERLLDEVVWWRSRIALATAATTTQELRGVPRMLGLISAVLHAVEADTALQAFLGHDAESALRILTGNRSQVQRGMSAAIERLIELETSRGQFATDLDPRTLAYAIVRISEAFLYADVIADREPDIDGATAVVEGLLKGLDRTPRD